MMISFLRLTALPSSVSLVNFGIYSERPLAVILFGRTPNLVYINRTKNKYETELLEFLEGYEISTTEDL